MKPPYDYEMSWQDVENILEVASRKDFWNEREVHIWCAPIIFREHFYPLLSQEERIKADKFRLLSDKERYIVSHGFLRLLLASYTNNAPSDINFERTIYGKPFIQYSKLCRSVHFNMSHSEDIVCVILSKNIGVGIDIEYVKDDFSWRTIADYHFSAEEMNQIRALPHNSQSRAFFVEWTRKEALLKATGKGLSGLEELKEGKHSSCHEEYTVTSFHCHNNYMGALAVKKKSPALSFFRYQYERDV